MNIINLYTQQSYFHKTLAIYVQRIIQYGKYMQPFVAILIHYFTRYIFVYFLSGIDSSYPLEYKWKSQCHSSLSDAKVPWLNAKRAPGVIFWLLLLPTIIKTS